MILPLAREIDAFVADWKASLATDIVGRVHRRPTVGIALLERASTDLREMTEYLSHQSWRCNYRTRYDECCCGLDELCARLGIDPVPPDDPEATP